MGRNEKCKLIENLYREHENHLYQLLKNRIHSSNQNDIYACLHDVFIILMTKEQHIEQMENIGGWLTLTAINVAMNFNKKEFRYYNFIDSQSAAAQEKTGHNDVEYSVLNKLDLEKAIELNIMERIKKELSKDENRLFHYKYELGLKNSQIAALMEISEANVNTRAGRLKKKIIDQVKNFLN